MCWSVTHMEVESPGFMPRIIHAEVVGMVLIDPGTLDDDPRFPPERQAELASGNALITLARWNSRHLA